MIIQQDEKIKKFGKKTKENKETDWILTVYKSCKKSDEGDYQGAIKVLEEFKNLSNKFPVYYELGDVYQKWKRYKVAIKMYKKQITIKPKHIGSYYEIVICYDELHEYKKAKKVATEALKLKLKNDSDKDTQRQIAEYVNRIPSH